MVRVPLSLPNPEAVSIGELCESQYHRALNSERSSMGVPYVERTKDFERFLLVRSDNENSDTAIPHENPTGRIWIQRFGHTGLQPSALIKVDFIEASDPEEPVSPYNADSFKLVDSLTVVNKGPVYEDVTEASRELRLRKVQELDDRRRYGLTIALANPVPLDYVYLA